jgi:hypothetical protein
VLDAADQLIEFEYRFASSILLGVVAQFPDQRALGHFLQAERGHNLVDIGGFYITPRKGSIQDHAAKAV